MNIGKSSRIMTALLLLLLGGSPVLAEKDSPVTAGRPDPVEGTLGYFAGQAGINHYFYAYMDEPVIRLAFRNSASIEDTGYRSDILMVDSALNDSNIKNPLISLSQLNYVPLNDASLSSQYGEAVTRARQYLTQLGADPDYAAAVSISATEAPSFYGTAFQTQYERVLGGGLDTGFLSESPILCSLLAIHLAGGTAERVEEAHSMVLLQEPSLGLSAEVLITPPDRGEPAGDQKVQAGDHLLFQITLRNTSDIWLENIQVSDTILSADKAFNLTVNGVAATINTDGILEINHLIGTNPMLSPDPAAAGQELVITYEYIVQAEEFLPSADHLLLVNTMTITASTPANSYRMQADEAGEYPYVGSPLSLVRTLDPVQQITTLRLEDTTPASTESPSSEETAPLSQPAASTPDTASPASAPGNLTAKTAGTGDETISWPLFLLFIGSGIGIVVLWKVKRPYN